MTQPLHIMLWGLVALCAVSMALVISKRREKLSAGIREPRWNRIPDSLIIVICFAGIFLFPMHLRVPLLLPRMRSLAYINFPGLIAVFLTVIRVRRWTWVEFLCFVLWLLLLIPLAISNREIKGDKTLAAIAQSLLPLFLLLYRMEPENRRKATGLFIILFDAFTAVLLICAVTEHFTDHSLLRWICERMEEASAEPKELYRYLQDQRFSSIWGHPLTNALFFNAFFAINVAWFRASGKKCPVPLFFIPALLGVLMCSSKTGITVCFLIFIAASWKYKKWLLLCIPVLAGLYFLGAFDAIIARFSEQSLTTGRAEDLAEYFASGINPLRFFSGYGDGSILSSSSPVNYVNDAFEFPIMMYSYYYGILFSLLHIGGAFAYATWRLLRKRKWLTWFCYLFVFAEINTYNAYALRSQDVCLFFCFLTLIFLNLPETGNGSEHGVLRTTTEESQMNQ